MPSSLDDAIAFCQTAPPVRKLKDFLDRTALSADLKALLYDLAQFTIKVGEVVVAIGRRMVSIALWLAQTIPNTALGVAVALTLTAVIGAIPFGVGTVLTLILNKLLLLIGLTAGAIEDIRQHAMKEAMDRVARQFASFGTVAA
ncbi:hypothetical protein [Paracoccus sp. AS002]|uniref:hypothetical protein n=1 Tax=Paracoccus sp. AS002 TaxID=3019545 RepID=UPI0023E79439|nr:hypothetical protein [Paracoccus sp. AS002]MDF3903391.1 hypothetical protein [Paracoccus sp. AS002]